MKRQSHNHGPDQGPGIACPEHPVGACLIVLDLSDAPVPTDLAGRNEPQKLVSMLRETADNFFVPDAAALACKVADQIEAQIAPPKPEEPQGLGAVVEAVYDNHFVRVGNGPAPWWRVGDPPSCGTCAYAEIDVIRVLSEGVVA